MHSILHLTPLPSQRGSPGPAAAAAAKRRLQPCEGSWLSGLHAADRRRPGLPGDLGRAARAPGEPWSVRLANWKAAALACCRCLERAKSPRYSRHIGKPRFGRYQVSLAFAAVWGNALDRRSIGCFYSLQPRMEQIGDPYLAGQAGLGWGFLFSRA